MKMKAARKFSSPTAKALIERSFIMKKIQPYLPQARKRQLLKREIAGEMLVYDQDNDQAHCLNSTAALVWSHCDGRTTVPQMAQMLAAEMKTPVGDDVVWFALEQLRKSHLLEESLASPPLVHVSRRALVRWGVAAAVTVPFIESITAPTAAQGATCLSSGATCGANAD
jgi:hypothetical protein